MTADPAISVVIPHFQQPEILAVTLDALAAQTGAPPFEVIVVDNASAEPPEAICAGRPGVQLTSETAKGPGPARNTGAAMARGAIIAFVDADCVPDPGWLAAIAAGFEADPQVAVLGGDVRILPVDPAAWTAIECYETVYDYRMRMFIEQHGYSGAGNMAVRRTIFEAVGPFVGLNMAEDMDWGRRATAAGHRIAFLPGAEVATPARTDFAELARKFDRHVGHDFALVRGRLPGLAGWVAKTLAMPLSPLAEIPTVLTTPRLSGMSQRIACFTCLARTRFWRARRMAELLFGADPDNLSAGWRRVG